MSVKKTQIVLIITALILFVLLFIAPKIAPVSNTDNKENSINKSKTSFNNADLSIYLNLAEKSLDLEKKKKIDKLISKSKFDSCVIFWDELKRPDIAAYYSEKLAEKENSAETWLRAGNRYYYAVQFIKDKSEIPALYQSAAKCFEKSIVISPDNVDAKIMLASCYIEGSDNPMEGIKKLKEIEKTDSNNLKLQLTFAFFSVKSGQLDKAINRFNNVLKIDSNYIEAYLHLADAYEQLDNKIKTIEMLEKYSAKTTDPTAKIEINKYIQQLKNK